MINFDDHASHVSMLTNEFSLRPGNFHEDDHDHDHDHDEDDNTTIFSGIIRDHSNDTADEHHINISQSTPILGLNMDTGTDMGMSMGMGMGMEIGIDQLAPPSWKSPTPQRSGSRYRSRSRNKTRNGNSHTSTRDSYRNQDSRDSGTDRNGNIETNSGTTESVCDQYSYHDIHNVDVDIFRTSDYSIFDAKSIRGSVVTLDPEKGKHSSAGISGKDKGTNGNGIGKKGMRTPTSTRNAAKRMKRKIVKSRKRIGKLFSRNK